MSVACQRYVTNVRRQNGVRNPLQLRCKPLPVPCRLLGENVDSSAGNVTAFDRLGEGGDINDVSAGKIQNVSALCSYVRLRFNHRVTFRMSEISAAPIKFAVCCVSGTCRVTKCAVVKTASSDGTLRAFPSASFGTTSKKITSKSQKAQPSKHLHAEGLAQEADLRSDMAVPDNANRLAAHLEAAVGALLPHAVVTLRASVTRLANQSGYGCCLMYLAGEHDDLSKGQLCDAASV